MPTTSSVFASISAVLLAGTLAACGDTDHGSLPGTNTTCTIALSASTDDAHLQAAIETALRSPDPCSLPDTPPHAEARPSSTGADLRTTYALVRIDRDEQSVRVVFEPVPGTRPSTPGE